MRVVSHKTAVSPRLRPSLSSITIQPPYSRPRKPAILNRTLPEKQRENVRIGESIGFSGFDNLSDTSFDQRIIPTRAKICETTRFREIILITNKAFKTTTTKPCKPLQGHPVSVPHLQVNNLLFSRV